jgi:thiamine kinase-like enzyme
MRRAFNNSALRQMDWLQINACRVQVLKPHRNRLAVEYNLLFRSKGRRSSFEHAIVGLWRQDGRSRQLYELLSALWQAGFNNQNELCVPRSLAHWSKLNLLLTEKATGKLLKQWVYSPDANWDYLLRRVAAWLAKLHDSSVKVDRWINFKDEINALNGWLADLMLSNQPWLSHEKGRIEALLEEIIYQQETNQPNQLCLTHGDFHPENIFVQGRRVTVIDFEHCGMGDPAADLGYLLSEIDIQADRYWQRRGRSNPLDMERLSEALLEEYSQCRPAQSLDLVPFYRARTYLKHLMYTVRMKGTDDPQSVTLWLDKAEACLKLFQPLWQCDELKHQAAALGGNFD